MYESDASEAHESVFEMNSATERTSRTHHIIKGSIKREKAREKTSHMKMKNGQKNDNLNWVENIFHQFAMKWKYGLALVLFSCFFLQYLMCSLLI